MVCPGTCWKSVSGGMEDARGREEEFPWYRYGGMWKVCFFFVFPFFGGGMGRDVFVFEGILGQWEGRDVLVQRWNGMMMFDVC